MASELKLTMDPQELDQREQAYLESQDWAAWIAFSDEISEAQTGEDEVRAIWRRLIKKFEGVLQNFKDENQFESASALSFYIGQIWDFKLNRQELAVQAYLQAFEYNATNISAIQAARTIYEDRQQWELALQLYTLELDLQSDTDDKASIYLKMAEICADHLGQQEDAVRCVKEATKLSSKSLGRFQSMMDEVTGHKQTEFEKLSAEAEASKNPRQKAKKLYDAAEVLISIDPEDERIENLLKQCLELDPRNEEAKTSLHRFYQLNERWSALSAFLADRLNNTQRRSDRLELLKQLAYINQYALKNDEESANWHKQVLELSPAEDESISFCANYFGEQEKWQDLVNIYESALKMHRRENEEAHMLFQIAMILWKKINHYVEADKYFRRIKANEPKNPVMLNFYVDFYREQEDWRKLLTTLATQQSNAEDDDERIKISVDMAILAENELASPDKAIETWKSILKIDPMHQQSREALHRLYRQGKKWNALLEQLKEEFELIDLDDVNARTEALLAQIDIYQNYLNQTTQAIAVYHQILDLNPHSQIALDALEKAYLQAEKWEQYFDILGKQAEILKVNANKEELLVRYQQMAKIAKDKLKDRDIAISYYEQVIELNEKDMSSLDSLAKLYVEAQSWQSLFETYQKQLSLLDPPDSTVKMVEMAHLSKNELSDHAQSIELWKEILNQSPERDDVWHELTDLYEKESLWDDLSALFESKINRIENKNQALPWMKKRAQLFATHLSDLDQSAEIWWKVLEIASGDADAEDFLKALFEDRKDWDSLEKLYELRSDFESSVKHLRSLVESESDRDQRIDLLRRVGICCQYKLSDEAGCIEAWERLLVDDATNLDAAETLVPFYEKQENWQGLEQLLLILEAATPKDIKILSSLANVYEQHLNLSQSAYDYFAKLLRIEPSHLNYLDAVIRTAQANHPHQWLDCVDLLEELSRDLADETLQLAYIRHLAQIQHLHLSKWIEAADCYEKVREIAGDEPEVLEALCEIYAKAEDWKSLLNIYHAQIKMLNQKDQTSEILSQKIDLQAQIAGLYETHLENLDKAQKAYEELRLLNPKNLAAIRGLQRIAEQKGDESSLSRYLSDELQQTENTETISKINHRLGNLAHQQNQDALAVEYYAKALVQDPLFTESADALQTFLKHDDQVLSYKAAKLIETFVRHHQQFDLLKEILLIQYEGSIEVGTRKKLLLEVAQIEENQLYSTVAAFESYQKLLIDDRTDENTLAQLERLATALQNYQDLARHYERFTFEGDLSDAGEKSKASHTQAAKYGRRLAQLQEFKLNDDLAARDTVELILKHEGDSREMIDLLKHLNEKLNDHDALVKTLERRINVVNSKKEKIDGLLNIAGLYDDILESPDDAISAYHRILGLDDQHEETNLLLDQLLRRTERYEDLADHLQNQKKITQDNHRKQELGYQLARVYHTHLEKHAGALEEYALVLAVAKHQPSIDAIEEILSIHSDGSEEIKEIRTKACDILAPIYEGNQDWVNIVHLLQVRLEDQEDQAERTSLYLKIAQCYETLGQDAIGAYHKYAQAFEEDFGNETLLIELQRLAQNYQLWAEFAGLLKLGLEDGKADADFERKLTLLALNAKIYEENLGDLASAIQTYEWLLSEEPNRKETLTDLSRLYEETENWEKLADILSQKIDIYEEEADRSRFAFKLGALFEEKMEDLQRAIDTYERIRTEIQSNSADAYVALERLYLKTSNFQQLVETYKDQAAILEDQAKRNILMKAAEVYEIKLTQHEDAVQVYQDILSFQPKDEEVLDRLSLLFDVLERYEDLLNILSEQKENAKSDQQKNELEYRRALLLINHLSNPIDALSSLKDVIKHDPAHQGAKEALEALLGMVEVSLEAAQELAPLYEKAGEWQKFVKVLHDTIEDREIEDQIVVLRRVAQVEEYQLSSPAVAFESLSEAYRLSKADLAIEQELERITKDLGLDFAFVALLEAVVSDANDEQREIQIRSNIALFAEEKLMDDDKAIEQYVSVLDLDSQSKTALDGLERLYQKQHKYQDLVEILEKKLELESNPEQRAILFQQIATIYDDLLSNTLSAIDTWKKHLSEQPQDVQALQALEALYQKDSAWDDLAEHYQQWITLLNDQIEQKTVIQSKLAYIYEEYLKDGEKAVAIYRDILVHFPAYEPVRQALSTLFKDESRALDLGVERKEIGEILEPLYRQEGNIVELVPVLQLKQEEENRDEKRIELLLEIASLQENQLHHKAEAFKSCLLVLELDASLTANRQHLHKLAVSKFEADFNPFELLADGLEQASADVTDEALQHTILLELGRVAEVYLDQNDRAQDAYRQIIDQNHEHEDGIKALVALFSKLGQWQPLIDLYKELGENAKEAENKMKFYFKAAALLKDSLDDPRQSIETYMSILEIDAKNAEAFKELERLYLELSEFQSLCDLYQDQIDAHNTAEMKAKLRHKQAKLYLEKLNMVDDAIETWRTLLLENDSTFVEAFEALEALEIQWKPQGIAQIQRQTIAEILAPLYFAQEKWTAWINTQETLIEFESDPWTQADMLVEIAKIQETKLSNATAALMTYGSAFEKKYPDQALQTEIYRLAQASGEWDKLIAFYMSGVEQCGDIDEVVKILLKVAQIQEVELKRINDAIATYQLAKSKDENQLETLNQLERLFEITERYADLVDILNAQAQLVDDVSKKKSYWYRVSALLEKELGRNEDAIEIYRNILDEDSEDLKAMDALNRIYTSLGKWEESVALLTDKQDLLKNKENATVQIANLHVIAQIQSELLAQFMPAIDTWSDILKLNPLDETALLRIKDTQRRLSLWDDLLSTLESERKHYETDAVHAIALDFEIAKLYETELNSVEQAIELYDSVLIRMPSHAEALIALEQMLNGQNRYESALVLEKHYQRENAYADLIRILDVQLSQVDDSQDKANLYKRQAKLYQEQLNDPRNAYECFFKALQADLEDEDSLKSLQGIAGQLGLYVELSAAYDLLAQKDPGSDISTALYRKRAKLCESKLNQVTDAIAAWEKVLEVESTDAEALTALTVLYEQNHQLDQLCEILSIRVEETPQDLALKVKYGRLLDSVKGQLTTAIEQWRDVLQADSKNEGARECLESKIAQGIELEEIADILQPIYEAQKQYASLVRLLEAKLQFGLVQDPYQQEEIYAKIAKLYHHELQNEVFAFEAYLQAFNLNPTNAEVREAFLSLGETLAERPRVMEALELALGSMGDPDLCEADHLRLAVWYEEMGERYQAIKHYQELLKINPAHTQALVALEENFKILEIWDELALIYRARIESLDDEASQIKYWHILAQLQRNKLYQDQAAIQSYDQILSMDESDLAAYGALAEIYLSLGQTKQLLDLYERQIESKTNLSADQKVEVLLKAGDLAFASQDRQRSANFYQKILEINATQTTAIDQLQVLYFQLADWDSLKEIKDKALKLAVIAQDEDQSLALYLELAQICQDRLMQPDDALQYFQSVLAIHPAHQEALQKTKALLKYQHQYTDLIKVLENYRAIAESTLSSTDLIDFYLELAEAYETEGQEEPAIEVLNQIRKYDENHSKALTLLARLYENNGNLEKAAETLNLALRNASGSDSVEAWRRLGNLYLDSLNDIEQAKAAYKNAVAQSGMTDIASMDALIRIAKDQDNQTDLLFWMDSKLPLLSGKDKAKALLDLSALKMKDDVEAAVRHLEEAYQLQASDLKIADKLLEFYLKAQRYDEAEPILSRIIQELQLAKQLKAISKYAYRQGQILEGRGNITAAKEAYLQCRQSDATFVPNLIAYSRLLCKLGEWDEAQEILKGLLLQRQVSNEEKVDIFYLNGMARLNANDPKKAKEMFQGALAVDANHAPSLEEMAKLG